MKTTKGHFWSVDKVALRFGCNNRSKNLERYLMCRASEAFKTEVLKNAYKKIWTKNSILIIKNKHNDGIKILNFEFLGVVGQWCDIDPT